MSTAHEAREESEMLQMASIVKDLPFFKERNMSESTFLEVLSVMGLMHKKRRRVLMEYGDEGDCFYFILKG